MGRPIEVTRLDLTAAALRELATRTRDGAVVKLSAGISADPGGPLTRGGRPAQRDGSADAAGLGASLQRRWRGRIEFAV